MKGQPITTQDLYNGVKSLTGKDSAYAVAKQLGANHQSACNWRDARTTMDDFYAMKAALQLGLDPDYVLACLAAERAQRGHQDETAAAWLRIAQRLAVAASVCYLALFSVLQTINPA